MPLRNVLSLQYIISILGQRSQPHAMTEFAHKINLIEALSETYKNVTEPSEAEVEEWSLQKIRQHYESGGQHEFSAEEHGTLKLLVLCK